MLEKIINRLDDAEERVSHMEDNISGNHPVRTAKKKKKVKKMRV